MFVMHQRTLPCEVRFLSRLAEQLQKKTLSTQINLILDSNWGALDFDVSRTIPLFERQGRLRLIVEPLPQVTQH